MCDIEKLPPARESKLDFPLAQQSTVATIFTSCWPQQRPQRGRMRCFLRIHCQYNSEDEPNVSYILPAKLGIICNARPLFCRILDVPAFTVPVSYHTKEFGGVVWKLETRPTRSWLAFVISHFSIIDRVVVVVWSWLARQNWGDQMELMQQKSEKRIPEVQVIGWIE